MFGQSWTVIGLLVEFVGVLMIFKWGPPQPEFDDYVTVSVSMSKAEERKVRRRKLEYRIMSSLALGLIAMGLFFQLADAWK